MKTLLSIVFTVILGYGVLVGYVYFFQARLIYFPNIGLGGAVPSNIGLDYEDVFFETTDGLRLNG